MKYHALTVFSVFFVTIAVFPALTVLIVSKTDSFDKKFFIPICCFFLFNLGDFVGRTVSHNLSLPLHRPVLLFTLSLLRWTMIPLIMLCNLRPRYHMPVFFKSEAYYIAFVTAFGFTNGYLFSNAMIHGPKFAPPEVKQKGGFVLVFFLGLGVAFGSLMSNVLLRLL